jgi:hypothetical protein
VSGWAALRARYQENERDYQRTWFEARRQAIHEIEREIVRLESLPSNPGRQSLLKKLRKSLTDPPVMVIR